MKLPFLLVVLYFANSCGNVSTTQNVNSPSGSGQSANMERGNSSPNTNSISSTPTPEVAENQTNQPRTVRDFFNLLPEKYFNLEGCDKAKDKNCNKARKEYIETFLEVEDTANGYWKSGCDGAQSCLTMALFKRPDTTYIVALMTEFEMGSDNYFLEYQGGKWNDLTSQIIPNFSKDNIYELPRKGTTIQVFKKKKVDTYITEKGEKIYELTWNAGKFSIKK